MTEHEKHGLKKLQRLILFGFKAYVDKNGYCVNPFYKRGEKAIEDNKNLARKVYPEVFQYFLASWFIRHGNLDSFIPDERMAELIV